MHAFAMNVQMLFVISFFFCSKFVVPEVEHLDTKSFVKRVTIGSKHK